MNELTVLLTRNESAGLPIGMAVYHRLAPQGQAELFELVRLLVNLEVVSVMIGIPPKRQDLGSLSSVLYEYDSVVGSLC